MAVGTMDCIQSGLLERLDGKSEIKRRFTKELRPVVRGGGRGYQNGGPPFANRSPRLSLFSDHLRTVLAVKGSLRRAQQRRALDGSGPFRTTTPEKLVPACHGAILARNLA